MKLIIPIVLLTNLLHLQAQNPQTSTKKFGVKAGINYSLMNFNKAFLPPDPSVKNTWKPGFSLGALLQLPLNRSLTFQPEYIFTQMRGEDDRIKTAYTISYLTLPLILKIAVANSIAIIAGPQFDLLISAKEKNNGSVTTITHDTEERNISGIAGLEVELSDSFFFDARYLQGFNHIGLGQRTATKEFKWAGVSLAVGIHF